MRPQLLAPIDDAVIYCGLDGATPRFSWSASLPRALDDHPDSIIQIVSERGALVTDTVPAIIERYVRTEPLALVNSPTHYFWRIGVFRNGSTPLWSGARRFTITAPARRAVVPSTLNDWDGIQNVMRQATSPGGPALVTFEKARRTLVPPPATAFVNLTSASDIIIDGGGSTLTFSNYVQFVLLINCSRVTVQNFVFDMDPLPYTALQIEAVDREAASVNASLLPGHPPLEDLYAAKTLHRAIAGVYSRNGSGGMPSTKRGVPEVITAGAWARRGSGTVPSYVVPVAWGGSKRPWSDHPTLGLESGDVLLFDPRIYAGFEVYVSDEVTLRGLEVLACSNECFTSEHAESLAILSCATRLRPGRLLAANNGGHNHHSASVGQWVEGGTWENAGDDTIHVSALLMSVASQLSPTELLLAPSYPDDVALRRPGVTLTLTL